MQFWPGWVESVFQTQFHPVLSFNGCTLITYDYIVIVYADSTFIAGIQLKIYFSSVVYNLPCCSVTGISDAVVHTHTTFFRDHPGEPVPEENFWTLWCRGTLTEADTPTIRLGATPSGLTSAHLHCCVRLVNKVGTPCNVFDFQNVR